MVLNEIDRLRAREKYFTSRILELENQNHNFERKLNAVIESVATTQVRVEHDKRQLKELIENHRQCRRENMHLMELVNKQAELLHQHNIMLLDEDFADTGPTVAP